MHSEDNRPLAICVRNLPSRSSDTSLKDGLFHEYKKHGKVTWVKVVGQHSDRYALVCFKKADDVDKALEVSHDKLFFGCKIEVAPYQGYDVEDNEFRPYEAELDEYHPKSTRTLFIGNLEKDITASELRKHFDCFGEIIEIDIKKQGVNAYAFCQYSDIISVVKAMRQMDGEHLGSNRIKLGFGKSMPTNCVWIDGISDNVSESYLTAQFNRFGPVSQVATDRERKLALVFFEQIQYAQMAVKEMRGVTLRGRKLQVDFASRECQDAFYDKLEKQGGVGQAPIDRPSGVAAFDATVREVTARGFETTVVVPGARFNRYDTPRSRASSFSRHSTSGAASPSSATAVPTGAAAILATGATTPRGGGSSSRRGRYVEYHDGTGEPFERRFMSYDEYSQGSAVSHEDLTDFTYARDRPESPVATMRLASVGSGSGSGLEQLDGLPVRRRSDRSPLGSVGALEDDYFTSGSGTVACVNATTPTTSAAQKHHRVVVQSVVVSAAADSQASSVSGVGGFGGSVSGSVVLTALFPPPGDIRHLQKERHHLLEQLEECPSSGDELVSPKKRMKFDPSIDSISSCVQTNLISDSNCDVIINHNNESSLSLQQQQQQRKSVEVRRLSECSSLKHCNAAAAAAAAAAANATTVAAASLPALQSAASLAAVSANNNTCRRPSTDNALSSVIAGNRHARDSHDHVIQMFTPHAVCKRRKTGNSLSESEHHSSRGRGHQLHSHHSHEASGGESADGSRPGTPLCDERPENLIPSEPRRLPRDRLHTVVEPMYLPLPRFAIQMYHQNRLLSSLAGGHHHSNASSSSSSSSSTTSMTNHSSLSHALSSPPPALLTRPPAANTSSVTANNSSTNPHQHHHNNNVMLPHPLCQQNQHHFLGNNNATYTTTTAAATATTQHLHQYQPNPLHPYHTQSSVEQPPASPSRAPSLSSNSSDSEIASSNSPSIEDRIKTLDEMFEKWSGGNSNRKHTFSDSTINSVSSSFYSRHKFMDMDVHEVQPSDIVRSVLAKKSIFDDDLKRLENIGDKYEPRDYANLTRPSLVGSTSATATLSSTSGIIANNTAGSQVVLKQLEVIKQMPAVPLVFQSPPVNQLHLRLNSASPMNSPQPMSPYNSPSPSPIALATNVTATTPVINTASPIVPQGNVVVNHKSTLNCVAITSVAAAAKGLQYPFPSHPPISTPPMPTTPLMQPAPPASSQAVQPPLPPLPILLQQPPLPAAVFPPPPPKTAEPTSAFITSTSSSTSAMSHAPNIISTSAPTTLNNLSATTTSTPVTSAIKPKTNSIHKSLSLQEKSCQSTNSRQFSKSVSIPGSTNVGTVKSISNHLQHNNKIEDPETVGSTNSIPFCESSNCQPKSRRSSQDFQSNKVFKGGSTSFSTPSTPPTTSSGGSVKQEKVSQKNTSNNKAESDRKRRNDSLDRRKNNENDMVSTSSDGEDAIVIPMVPELTPPPLPEPPNRLPQPPPLPPPPPPLPPAQDQAKPDAATDNPAAKCKEEAVAATLDKSIQRHEYDSHQHRENDDISRICRDEDRKEHLRKDHQRKDREDNKERDELRRKNHHHHQDREEQQEDIERLNRKLTILAEQVREAEEEEQREEAAAAAAASASDFICKQEIDDEDHVQSHQLHLQKCGHDNDGASDQHLSYKERHYNKDDFHHQKNDRHNKENSSHASRESTPMRNSDDLQMILMRRERNSSGGGSPGRISSKRRLSSQDSIELDADGKRFKFSASDSRKILDRRDFKDPNRSSDKSSSKHYRHHSKSSSLPNKSIEEKLFSAEERIRKDSGFDERRKERGERHRSNERSMSEKHKGRKIKDEKHDMGCNSHHQTDENDIDLRSSSEKCYHDSMDVRSSEDEQNKERKKHQQQSDGGIPMDEQSSNAYRQYGSGENNKQQRGTGGGDSGDKKSSSSDKRNDRHNNSGDRRSGGGEGRRNDDNSSHTSSTKSSSERRSRLRKQNANSSDDSDSDEPKKHSIFDIPDDAPAYISMYDKVKARSCKNMQKQEEEKKIKAKFSQLKQSRAKREEKKRSNSWDEDSDSEGDLEHRIKQHKSKSCIDSSSEGDDDEHRSHGDRPSKDMMSDSESEPRRRNYHRNRPNELCDGESSESTIHNHKPRRKISSRKNSRSTRIASDSSDDGAGSSLMITNIKEEVLDISSSPNQQTVSILSKSLEAAEEKLASQDVAIKMDVKLEPFDDENQQVRKINVKAETKSPAIKPTPIKESVSKIDSLKVEIKSEPKEESAFDFVVDRLTSTTDDPLCCDTPSSAATTTTGTTTAATTPNSSTVHDSKESIFEHLFSPELRKKHKKNKKRQKSSGPPSIDADDNNDKHAFDAVFDGLKREDVFHSSEKRRHTSRKEKKREKSKDEHDRTREERYRQKKLKRQAKLSSVSSSSMFESLDSSAATIPLSTATVQTTAGVVTAAVTSLAVSPTSTVTTINNIGNFNSAAAKRGEKMEDIFGPISDDDSHPPLSAPLTPVTPVAVAMNDSAATAVSTPTTITPNTSCPSDASSTPAQGSIPATPGKDINWSASTNSSADNLDSSEMPLTITNKPMPHMKSFVDKEKHREKKKEKKRKEREKHQYISKDDENSVDLDAAGRALEAQLMADVDIKSEEVSTAVLVTDIKATADSTGSVDVFHFSDGDESIEMLDKDKRPDHSDSSHRSKEKKKKKKRSKDEKHQRHHHHSSRENSVGRNLLSPLPHVEGVVAPTPPLPTQAQPTTPSPPPPPPSTSNDSKIADTKTAELSINIKSDAESAVKCIQNKVAQSLPCLLDDGPIEPPVIVLSPTIMKDPKLLSPIQKTLTAVTATPPSSRAAPDTRRDNKNLIPGFGTECDENIHESAVQSIFTDYTTPIKTKTLPEPIVIEMPKLDEVADITKLEEKVDEKSRVIISQEETEDAVAALLGESYGNSSTDYVDCYEPDPIVEEEISAPAAPEETVIPEEEAEEMRKAVQSLNSEELDMKPDTPQSDNDLQIDTDTEDVDEENVTALSLEIAPKTPDAEMSQIGKASPESTTADKTTPEKTTPEKTTPEKVDTPKALPSPVKLLKVITTTTVVTSSVITKTIASSMPLLSTNSIELTKKAVIVSTTLTASTSSQSHPKLVRAPAVSVAATRPQLIYSASQPSISGTPPVTTSRPVGSYVAPVITIPTTDRQFYPQITGVMLSPRASVSVAADQRLLSPHPAQQQQFTVKASPPQSPNIVRPPRFPNTSGQSQPPHHLIQRHLRSPTGGQMQTLTNKQPHNTVVISSALGSTTTSNIMLNRMPITPVLAPISSKPMQPTNIILPQPSMAQHSQIGTAAQKTGLPMSTITLATGDARTMVTYSTVRTTATNVPSTTSKPITPSVAQKQILQNQNQFVVKQNFAEMSSNAHVTKTTPNFHHGPKLSQVTSQQQQQQVQKQSMQQQHTKMQQQMQPNMVSQFRPGAKLPTATQTLSTTPAAGQQTPTMIRSQSPMQTALTKPLSNMSAQQSSQRPIYGGQQPPSSENVQRQPKSVHLQFQKQGVAQPISPTNIRQSSPSLPLPIQPQLPTVQSVQKQKSAIQPVLFQRGSKLETTSSHTPSPPSKVEAPIENRDISSPLPSPRNVVISPAVVAQPLATADLQPTNAIAPSVDQIVTNPEAKTVEKQASVPVLEIPKELTVDTPVSVIRLSDVATPSPTISESSSRSHFLLTEENVTKLSAPLSTVEADHQEEQDSKEDSDYWSAKEVNIDSVIKKVDALCSGGEESEEGSAISCKEDVKDLEVIVNSDKNLNTDDVTEASADKTSEKPVHNLDEDEFDEGVGVNLESKLNAASRPTGKRSRLVRGRKPPPANTATITTATTTARPSDEPIKSNNNNSLEVPTGVQTRRGTTTKTPSKRGRGGARAATAKTITATIASTSPPRTGSERKPRNQNSESDIYEFHEDSGDEAAPTVPASTVSTATAALATVAVSKPNDTLIRPRLILTIKQSSAPAPAITTAQAVVPPVDPAVIVTAATSAPTAVTASISVLPCVVVPVDHMPSQPQQQLSASPVEQRELSPHQLVTSSSIVLGSSQDTSPQQPSDPNAVKDDFSAPTSANVRKSRRLLERDGSRSTIDDIIEDVVKNLATSQMQQQLQQQQQQSQPQKIIEPNTSVPSGVPKPTSIPSSVAIAPPIPVAPVATVIGASQQPASNLTPPRRSTRSTAQIIAGGKQIAGDKSATDVRKSPRANRRTKDRKESDTSMDSNDERFKMEDKDTTDEERVTLKVSNETIETKPRMEDPKPDKVNKQPDVQAAAKNTEAVRISIEPPKIAVESKPLQISSVVETKIPQETKAVVSELSVEPKEPGLIKPPEPGSDPQELIDPVTGLVTLVQQSKEGQYVPVPGACPPTVAALKAAATFNTQVLAQRANAASAALQVEASTGQVPTQPTSLVVSTVPLVTQKPNTILTTVAPSQAPPVSPIKVAVKQPTLPQQVIIPHKPVTSISTIVTNSPVVVKQQQPIQQPKLSQQQQPPIVIVNSTAPIATTNSGPNQIKAQPARIHPLKAHVLSAAQNPKSPITISPTGVSSGSVVKLVQQHPNIQTSVVQIPQQLIQLPQQQQQLHNQQHQPKLHQQTPNTLVVSNSFPSRTGSPMVPGGGQQQHNATALHVNVGRVGSPNTAAVTTHSPRPNQHSPHPSKVHVQQQSPIISQTIHMQKQQPQQSQQQPIHMHPLPHNIQQQASIIAQTNQQTQQLIMHGGNKIAGNIPGTNTFSTVVQSGKMAQQQQQQQHLLHQQPAIQQISKHHGAGQQQQGPLQIVQQPGGPIQIQHLQKQPAHIIGHQVPLKQQPQQTQSSQQHVSHIQHGGTSSKMHGQPIHLQQHQPPLTQTIQQTGGSQHIMTCGTPASVLPHQQQPIPPQQTVVNAKTILMQQQQQLQSGPSKSVLNQQQPPQPPNKVVVGLHQSPQIMTGAVASPPLKQPHLNSQQPIVTGKFEVLINWIQTFTRILYFIHRC